MEIAELFDNLAKKKLLWALSDGRAFTAIELAGYIHVEAKEVSQILNELEQKGTVVRETNRHQYFRLGEQIDPETLHQALELEMQNVPKLYIETNSISGLRYCRSCHNHLAGKVGRDLAQKLQDKGYLKLERVGEQFQSRVTSSGLTFFKELGVDTNSLTVNDELVTKACLDFSERKHHLGGKMGVVLLDKMKEKGWIIRKDKSRIHEITPAGKKAFKEWFGMENIISKKA